MLFPSALVKRRQDLKDIPKKSDRGKKNEVGTGEMEK